VYVLRVLHLGLPLEAKATGTLVEVFLFPAIVGFSRPTCGGRQCWNNVFQQVSQLCLCPAGAPSGGLRLVNSRKARVSLRYSPTMLSKYLHLPFYRALFTSMDLYINARDGGSTF
jgi:hypothetical protein